MVEPLRPARGGFLRPFGCGQFIKEFLLGHRPEGSLKIDPDRGAAIDDIRYAYKSALLRAYAKDMVAVAMEKGIELSVEEALERIPHRLTKMRSHSFYRYFHHLKMLGWVEATGEEEESGMGGTPGALIKKGDKGIPEHGLGCSLVSPKWERSRSLFGPGNCASRGKCPQNLPVSPCNFPHLP